MLGCVAFLGGEFRVFRGTIFSDFFFFPKNVDTEEYRQRVTTVRLYQFKVLLMALCPSYRNVFSADASQKWIGPCISVGRFYRMNPLGMWLEVCKTWLIFVVI